MAHGVARGVPSNSNHHDKFDLAERLDITGGKLGAWRRRRPSGQSRVPASKFGAGSSPPQTNAEPIVLCAMHSNDEKEFSNSALIMIENGFSRKGSTVLYRLSPTPDTCAQNLQSDVVSVVFFG